MAFRRTLKASEWDMEFDVPNAYFRLHKIKVLRYLEGELSEDETVDERTNYYNCRMTFTVFSDTPNKQGKPFHSVSYEERLDVLDTFEGETLIDKAYNYLAANEFALAESV